jgi:hypothetical protein
MWWPARSVYLKSAWKRRSWVPSPCHDGATAGEGRGAPLLPCAAAGEGCRRGGRGSGAVLHRLSLTCGPEAPRAHTSVAVLHRNSPRGGVAEEMRTSRREENMLRDIMGGGELGRQRDVLSIQIFIARRRFSPNFHGRPRPKRWNRHEFATHKNIRYYVCVVKRRFVL